MKKKVRILEGRKGIIKNVELTRKRKTLRSKNVLETRTFTKLRSFYYSDKIKSESNCIINKFLFSEKEPKEFLH